MTRQRTARCAHCGDEFAVANRSGPDPTYCSRAHRQAAYEARRRASRPGDDQAREQELNRLRSRISWLERDNAELRRERDEAVAEIARLQHQLNPPSPVLQRLLAPPGQPSHPVEPPHARRRWKLSR